MLNRRTLLALSAAAGLTAIAACAPMAQGPGDIVDIAAANPDFSTLVTAVQAAGLVDTLKGPGPFTVFAPTNEAFAKLPAGTVEELLKPENKDKLVAILTYHVVSGAVMSESLAGQKMDVATVQGQTVHINGTNGVIHVIDTVLLPK